MCLAHTAEAIHTRDGSPVGHRHSGGISRRAALVAGAGAAFTALLPAPVSAAARMGGHGRSGLEDLTHVFSVDFPVYVPTETATRRPAVTFEGSGYYLQEWTFYEHTATHVDAPGHFAPGGRLAPDITPEELIVPAVVVDIKDRAQADPDTVVTVDDLRAFERRCGRIPEGAAVLMNSGWQARLGDPEAYRGADAQGVLHFPGFGAEAVDWLVRRRRITAIGVDTLSLDPGNSTTFDTHVTLLTADRYGLENVANLDRIPPRGARIIVGLVPWEEGSGGPCRVLAQW
jgi:kynurenine formamidase